MIESIEEVNSNIEGYEFGIPNGWRLLSLSSVEKKEVKSELSDHIGVYIVRSNNPIGRVMGQSNILYIGSGGLRSRLISLLDFSFTEFSNNTKRKHTAKPALKRIHEELGIHIEVLYIKTLSGIDKQIESLLISNYCSQHIEPPPLNNTRK